MPRHAWQRRLAERVYEQPTGPTETCIATQWHTVCWQTINSSLIGYSLRNNNLVRRGMTRTPVQSQMIRSVGYDGRTRTLELEFEAGTVYQYAEVPEFTFRALMHARSKGAFFAKSIDGHYRHVEVTKNSL